MTTARMTVGPVMLTMTLGWTWSRRHAGRSLPVGMAGRESTLDVPAAVGASDAELVRLRHGFDFDESRRAAQTLAATIGFRG